MQHIGWWVIGLSLLPLMRATAEPQSAQPLTERLEWLLTSHDVRHAIHAPRVDAHECAQTTAERDR